MRLKSFTVYKIGDFPHFLSVLASNNQFITKLVKMWSELQYGVPSKGIVRYSTKPRKFVGITI